MNKKSIRKRKNLSADTSVKTESRILNYVQKSMSRTRQDVRSWNQALQMAMSDDPRNWMLQTLYSEINNDALLTSQIKNRVQQVDSMEFNLVNAKGEPDEEATTQLKQLASYRKLNRLMNESTYFGYNLVELQVIDLPDGRKDFKPILIPRTNVVPRSGLFFPDYNEDKHIPYRELPEFGKWIIEFNTEDIGLLNKAVSHILFKRFAQSCWAELCEIYGIPPRVMKTNTSDPRQLNKAEKMMRDMGAAAWFIIDRTEEFEWASGVDSNGDVYSNLINLCNNEISMLVSGAIIGQDTKHGSYSKESASQNVLWDLVQSDMAMLEDWWTNLLLPAYAHQGILKPGLRFEFAPSEDIDQLFEFTTGLLPFKEVDDEWIKEKFGVEVTGNREFGMPFGNDLKAGSDFFL